MKTITCFLVSLLVSLSVWASSSGSQGGVFSPTRTKTVCGSGCDYISISDAFAFVSTQPRSAFEQWLIQVYSAGPIGACNYVEVSWTVPSYTTAQGLPSILSLAGTIDRPVVCFSSTSGPAIVMSEQSKLSNLYLNGQLGVVLTGNASIISSTGTSALNNVTVSESRTLGGFSSDVVSCSSGLLVIADSYLTGNNTAIRSLVATGSCSVSIYRGRFLGSGATKLIENAGSGTMRFYGSRFDAGATTDITRSGSGVIVVRESEYVTASGSAIDDGIGRFDSIRTDRIVTTGNVPSVSDCGTSPSVSGNDTAGTVTIGTGVVTSCTVTFSTAKSNTPRVVGLVPSTAVACGVTAKSTTSFTATCAASIAGGSFDYLVVE